MGRSRGTWLLDRGSFSNSPLLPVMSFMSSFGGPPRSPPSATPPAAQTRRQETASPLPQQTGTELTRKSPTPRTRQERSQSLRPASMIGGYQPPLMEIAHDTIPELAPIFTFLNSHSNKLYQEGYFLKLNDLDTRESEQLSQDASLSLTLWCRWQTIWGSVMG